MAPAKHERDSKNPTVTFTRADIFLTEKLTNRVHPHPHPPPHTLTLELLQVMACPTHLSSVSTRGRNFSVTIFNTIPLYEFRHGNTITNGLVYNSVAPYCITYTRITRCIASNRGLHPTIHPSISIFRLSCCPCPIPWGWQYQAKSNTGSPCIFAPVNTTMPQ